MKKEKDTHYEDERGKNKLSVFCFLLQVLKQHGHNPIFIGNDAEVLENYVKKITPITPTLDNRLTIIE